MGLRHFLGVVTSPFQVSLFGPSARLGMRCIYMHECLVKVLGRGQLWASWAQAVVEPGLQDSVLLLTPGGTSPKDDP